MNSIHFKKAQMFYTPKPQRLLIKAAAFLLMLFATSASCKTTKEHPLRSQNPNLPDPYGANRHINWVKLNDGVEYALLENQFETDVHIVKIDLKNPNLKIVVSPEAEKGSNPLEHALNADAYVSLNAAFFDGAFNPRGIAISNGTKWNSTLYPESSPFIFCDIKNICGINHKGSDSIESTWYNAVGGYHSLVSLRKMRTRQDDLNCGSFCTNSHPRSAIGITENGRFLLFMLAEGRRSDAKGLTLLETSKIIHYAGAYEAINLDGGGSSSLIIDGELVSKRPTKEPTIRPVSNSIMVIQE